MKLHTYILNSNSISGKPDPPFNCSVQNITSESLEVECVEGFDNGNGTQNANT